MTKATAADTVDRTLPTHSLILDTGDGTWNMTGCFSAYAAQPETIAETIGDTPVGGGDRRIVFDACGGAGDRRVCFGLVCF